MRFILYPALSLTILVSASASASASELTILDCTGNVKAIENIEGSSLSSVEIALESDAESLVLAANTGENLLSPVEKNRSRFSSVAPGRWTLCKPDKEYIAFSVSKISQTSGIHSASVSTALLGGSAIAAVSAVAFTAGSSSSSSGSSSLNQDPGGSIGGNEESPALPEPAVSFDDSDFPLGSPAAPLEPYTPLSPFK